MSDNAITAVVVGGGLAGLAAGIKLMEDRPGAKVTLYQMGHHLGGKATSYRDDEGFNIDHGFHAMSINYHRMLDLLKRSKVDLSKTLVRDRGTYYYNERTSRIGRSGSLASLFDPDARKMASFFSKNLKIIYQQPDIEQYDDICWTAWSIRHGLDASLTKTRSFRFSQDALFNTPHPVSAYITMKSLRLLGGSSNYYLVDGTYGEDIIEPIVDHFRRLGGTIKVFHKLTEVLHDGERITGLRFAMPDFGFHHRGRTKWEREVRVLPEPTTMVTGFDHVVLAVPVDSFRELNRGDRVFWRGFSGVENLQSVATLSLQVWTEQCVLPDVSACINALDQPLPMVIDYKDLKTAYRSDPAIGSALEWVGQETGFEHFSDQALKATAYDCLARIPGAKDPRQAGILRESLNRNMSNHERYLLTDPGTLRFRPGSKTHFRNLFLAGDWIRNQVDVPTMEGAICSGYTAIEELLKEA